MLTKRIAAFLCAIALSGVCTLSLQGGVNITTADAANIITKTDGCASSNNSIYTSYHIYGNQDKTVRSYLYQSGDNKLTRVEFIPTSSNTVDYYDLDTGYVLIEEIDMSSGKLISSKKMDLSDSMFLPLFGGFYAGEKYNYIVTGQQNLSEDNDQPVFAVTRLSKDFKNRKTKILKGRNTYIPFKAGSCRMTEAGGKLYIHTCHQMYKSDDGNRHQMNMSYVLDTESMTFEKEYYEVKWHYDDAPFPFVSHSFDQFIISDDKNIYTYDSGDANPRSLVLCKYDLTASKRYDSNIVDIPKASSHYNYTSVLTGGMALSKNNVLIGVKMADMSKSTLDDYYDLKDIYILVTPKSKIGTDTKATLVNLTNYENKDQSESGTVRRNSAPKIVKINDNKFIVMWKECTGSPSWWSSLENKDGVTKIAVIDGSGKLIGKVTETDKLPLSDCDPILCSDGMVRWYTAQGSAPVLYALDPNDPTNFGKARIPGDANDDGEVDLKDVIVMKQFLANWNVKINESNADVDGSGDVSLNDVILLKQKLANWKVTLK